MMGVYVPVPHVHRVSPNLAMEVWGPRRIDPMRIAPGGRTAYSTSPDGLVAVFCDQPSCAPEESR